MPAKKNGARAATGRKSPQSSTRRSAPSAKRKAAATSARGARVDGQRPGPEEVLAALRSAGTEQNRKIYRRHGAEEPLFGVSYAEIKKLVKRIGVDQALARSLWESGNSDARTLAIKVADPGAMSLADLRGWVVASRFHTDGVAQLASEGPHALEAVGEWLRQSNETEGRAAWVLVSLLALRDASLADAWFLARLAEIEARISGAPNLQRAAMLQAIIAVGGRSPALRKAALAAAKRIGPVEIDHGETACQTPDAEEYLEKMWAHARAKGFSTPAEQERSREPIRTRC